MRKSLVALFGILLLSFTFIGAEDEQQAKLLKIAGEYQTYAMYVHPEKPPVEWTIAPCAAASSKGPAPDSLHYSRALKTASPHGDKLYKLYISDPASYLDTAVHQQPQGQTIVKETWTVRKIPIDSVRFYPLAKQSRIDMLYYIPVERSQIFVMYKETPSATNDKGWVYGITDLASGKQQLKVIQNGKLSNCVGCHKDNKYDRIFGPK